MFETVSTRTTVDSFEHNSSFIRYYLINDMFQPIGPGPKHVVEVIVNKWFVVFDFICCDSCYLQYNRN